MKDTSLKMERKFRKMLLQRSSEERLKMGCSMHATARALAKASISRQHAGAEPAEIKRLLFLHFYGNDFEPEEGKRIVLSLGRNNRLVHQARRSRKTPRQSVSPSRSRLRKK